MTPSIHSNRTKHSTLGTVLCSAVVCLLLAACQNDMEELASFSKKDLPQQAISNVHMERSEYGNRQMSMDAPQVVSYNTPEKKTVYPKGLHVVFYNTARQKVADMRADYAEQLPEKKLTEVRGNVVIVDFQSGDTSYLSTLTWNEMDHRVYSSEPVKSVNGPRVTYGDGFESDDAFTTPLIIGQRGTMTFEDE